MKAILVDDEEVAVNALKRRVDWKRYGVDEVFIAHSMEEAQNIFRESKIDLMLSDIEMPFGNGLKLFEWVKVYYPDVACVFVTCHPEYEYMRKALQLGSADYVLKPIDYEELDGVLARLTQRPGKESAPLPQIPSEILNKLEEKNPSSDTIASVKRYIREHIQSTIHISELASEVFLNEQYLMRLFKKAEGISLLEYITNERLHIAKELLTGTDYPIHQVAEAVGYGNYSYFTRIFKRDVGITPQIYRQNSRLG